jgi:hypothetical protein
VVAESDLGIGKLLADNRFMNTTRSNDSLQASLATARRFGASTQEVRKIHDLVKRHKSPANVRSFEVRFGKDSTGDPAVWIRFLVDDDLNPSQKQISQLTEFGNKVRSELLGADIRYWPYVEFRAAA